MDRLKHIGFFIALPVFTVMLLLPFIRDAHAEEGLYLRQGITDYKAENFEEALPALLKAYKETPSSPQTTYYIGLTYKELLNYARAKTYLEKTIELKPSMTEAYIPLAEVLYSQGQARDAEGTLKESRSKGVTSARGSYMMGLILLDRGKKKEARVEFQNAIALEPGSEAAALSGDALNTMGYKASQLALVVGYTFQYDDNVILKPSDDVSGIAVSDEKDTRHVLTVGGDYSTSWGDIGLRTGYSFYQNQHKDLDHMDVQAHSLLLMPSVDINKGKVLLLGGYDYYLLDNDKYLKTITLKPSWVFSTENGKGINLFVGVSYKDFLQTPGSKAEERDGTNVNGGFGILLPFNADRSYLKIDYTFDSEDTDGDNWDYSGHRGGALLSHPLAPATKFTLAGSYYQQDYKNKNTNSILGEKREDKISAVDATLTYSYKGVDLKLQYSYSKASSNITVYDYSRSIAGIGAEYTF